MRADGVAPETGERPLRMHFLHGNWVRGELHIWAEGTRTNDFSLAPEEESDVSSSPGLQHTFATPAEVLRELLERAGIPAGELKKTSFSIRLPSKAATPCPSPSLAHAAGFAAHGDEETEPIRIREFAVSSLAVVPGKILTVLRELEELEETDLPEGIRIADSLRYWFRVSHFATHLLAGQRFVPMIEQLGSGELRGCWHPWLASDEALQQVVKLIEAMPAVARAATDDLENDSFLVLRSFLDAVIDAEVRRHLIAEDMHEAVAGRNAEEDSHVAWLSGLLSEKDTIIAPKGDVTGMLSTVSNWIAQLDQRGNRAEFRLFLQLIEPINPDIRDLQAPDDSTTWQLKFGLVSPEDSLVRVNAEDVWAAPAAGMVVEKHRIDSPHELLLAELAKAARVFPQLEDAFDESTPTGLLLNTREAYQFLREVRPLLLESGVEVEVPSWWHNPSARLGARLLIDSDALPTDEEAASSTSSGSSGFAELGLGALVRYTWQIALGKHILTLKEFEDLARQGSPLVRAGDQWVEIRPEDMQHAVAFLSKNPGGETTLMEAVRLAYASDSQRTGLPVLGMSATGWVDQLFGAGDSENTFMQQAEVPDTFHGELRPYQERGLSWLVFLQKMGLGACLADDMGLGKTIQLLALLLYERDEYRKKAQQAAAQGRPAPPPLKPTLLIVPTSVVTNWMREAKKFAPSLKVLIHHGPDRPAGNDLLEAAAEHDMVITTYALAHRDSPHLRPVHWGRIVLDEAQCIKNPASKQSAAIRSLNTDSRVALTGTPVENRLQELWSIIDFLNPAYLGKLGDFRRTFAIPVERYNRKEPANRLRSMIRPFVLRRLKTDPNVISDLPEKIEAKEFVQLTPEQAKLYQQTVDTMLSDVDRASGIRRRGMVLATLIKLKQICNHPAQLFRQTAQGIEVSGSMHTVGPPPELKRSGKCIRICEMLEEVIAEGDRALIFTQFRQMGHILASILRHHLDREILFMHGGVPSGQRQQMIDRFQKEDSPSPVFILSLKAGGFGLNLTAANHVFHFDRWWNPAVENQATDRAFRIGQTQTVFVHKFICAGTLEERIDRMIERKLRLAENIVSSGEDWLTELSTQQLREVLELQPEAVSTELTNGRERSS